MKIGKKNKKNTKKKFNSGEFYLRPHIMIGLRQKHDDGMELDPTPSIPVLFYKKWYFVNKIVLIYCEKKLLKQLIQTVKGQKNFW